MVCMRTGIRSVRVGRTVASWKNLELLPFHCDTTTVQPPNIVVSHMVVDPLAWWVSEFPCTPPVGHVLRGALAERWVRFHSLPGSKRYPDSENEFEELLMRHRAVAGELFASGEKIYVYRCHLGEPKLKAGRRHQIAGRQLRDCVVRFAAVDGPVGNEDYYFTRALATLWEPDFFEPLIRQVAQWELAGITFVSPRNGNMYCPYDGGMDVFCLPATSCWIKERFGSWMSTHASQL